MKRWVFALFIGAGLALAQFNDVRPSNSEWLALQALSQMGVVYGYPDGSFRGSRALSRREAVLMLYRLWLKAREENNRALEELSKRLAQEIVGMARNQVALEERLDRLTELLNQAINQEEAAAIREEIASLKAALGSFEEAISLLLSQYADLLQSQREVEAKIAEVDQRTLAWNEDSVNLQKEVNRLREELARISHQTEATRQTIETRLQTAIQQQEAGWRNALEEARAKTLDDVRELRASLSNSVQRIQEMEGRLTSTREELFKLAEEVKRTREELTTRINAIERTPPPFYFGGLTSGLSPLLLGGFVGHEGLLGMGVRVGAEWRQDTGEVRGYGVFTLPIFREPARGNIGFGLSYALSGPNSGEAAFVGLVGGGVAFLNSLEFYSEAKTFFPLDGATPFARFGLGLRVRP